MADDQLLSRELASLLGTLPHAHLIEITRTAALGAFKTACRKLLGEATLESTLASVFPDFSGGKISEIARRMGLCAVRNNYWSQILALPDKKEVQIRVPNPAIAQALRDRSGPAIVAFWHFGASNVLPLGMQRIGVPALIVSRKPPHRWFRRAVSPGIKVAVTNNDPSQAILVLKQALDQLRKGGVVVLEVDGSEGQKELTVPFLGRTIALSRGMAELARLTGAPIFPCAMTWGPKDWSFDFRLFAPVTLPSTGEMKAEVWDHQVLTELGRRFEEIVRAFPGQSRLERLAALALAPRL